MLKNKKICFRLTTRRIIGAILTAASMLNLLIVGAVFIDAPTSSILTPGLTTFNPTLTSLISTSTSIVPTDTPTPTSSPIPTYTLTSTNTVTQTPTYMISPTDTLTASPSPFPCIPRYSWPIYRVQSGDTLFSLARATGSTVDELKLANCLPDDQIDVGQLLYVPRLPINTLTPTPKDSLTVFQNPSLCYVSYNNNISFSFSVTPYDPQGVSSVTALYNINGGPWIEIAMRPDGDTYYGVGSVSAKYSTSDTVNYYFRAIDSLGYITNSNEYNARLTYCYVG